MAVVAAIVLFVLLSPQRVDDVERGGQISFWTAQGTLLDSLCADIYWQVDGIESVYLNGQGRVGEDHQQLCGTPPDPIIATLSVHFRDGTQVDYSLSVNTTLWQWPTLVLILDYIVVIGYLNAGWVERRWRIVMQDARLQPFIHRARGSSRLRNFSVWLMQPLHFILMLCTIAPIVSLGIYISKNSPRFPFLDMWWVNADPIIRVVTGKGVTFRYLAAPTGYAYLLFNRLISIFFALTVHWNLDYEQYLVFALGLANFIFLVLLFRRYHPSAMHLVLVPFAALALSTRSGVMWLLAAEGWHLAIFFFLLSLVALAYIPGKWLALIVAGGSALCSALSFVVGLPTALILIPAAWMMGYRKLKYQLFLVAILCLDVLLYYWATIYGAHNSITTADPAQSVGYHLQAVVGRIPYAIILLNLPNRFFSILGSSVAGGVDLQITAFVGLLAVVILIANIVYLWRQERTLNRIGVWLVVSLFVLINVGLFAFRIQDAVDRQDKGLYVRYAFLALYFWVALLAISILVLVRIFTEGQWSKQILAYLNIGFLVFALSLYLFTLGPGAAATTIPFEQLATVKANDDCAARYPLDRNNCIFGTKDVIWTNRPDYLAAYGLSGYAAVKPTLVLPAAYKSADEVIVSTESAWRDLHIRDWLLTGVPDNHILNMVPASEQAILDTEIVDTPKPLENVFVGSEAIKTRTQTINSDRVWLITGTSEKLQDLLPALEANYRLVETTKLPYQLVLFEYIRSSELVHR